MLSHAPKPLLNDIVSGRCIPIIGAGFSSNAIVPESKKIPLWNDLGREFAHMLPNYPYSNPIDAISAYCQEYSRSKLVEELARLLFVGTAQPGSAHLAFCELPFDIVCTTNFDFLLEKSYESKPQATYCRPVIDEDQLSVAPLEPGVSLIKLHGDLHHPSRLVVTEEDYDTFIDRYPLLSTYLGNLLITRTPLFVGYSLEDPDFRQIWQIISNRLDRMRRPAYVLTVGIRKPDASRYQRRGVKVLDLPGSTASYNKILTQFFDELRTYWSSQLIQSSTIIDESLGELSLPEGATTRLCYFAVPLALQSFYRSLVFPIAEGFGLVPMTSDSVVSPGDNVIAKITALLDRAQIVVADVSTSWGSTELEMAIKRKVRPRILVILPEDSLPVQISMRFRGIEIEGVNIIRRPKDLSFTPHEFLAKIEDWFQKVAEELRLQVSEEPQRLLQKREYRPAVISAMTLFETVLAEFLPKGQYEKEKRPLPMYKMLKLARESNLITERESDALRNYWAIRTQLVHTKATIRASQAQKIVREVMRIVSSIGQKAS